ncbi:hypothetical protein L198_02186 [Cryptococcus wingfieldii CBS 7118]|uniref:mRNA 3'-end-processing protein RNA14 n=1 Tax=Cryptococcus wingfieldii CBS 7118 TaxID=1295528 RepID=A0A1E3JR39_9TREE|nr:hypothetical protein L198_02186 [Cryptococcus wingfieldii CBS 7118]ODO03341.1 hypothetical protein L198_02186 [Cryptococcus wingfieldii CBS 7118]
MSDPQPSTSNPAEIVHQLHNIDAIQQDLADTAAAVENTGAQGHPEGASDESSQAVLLDNAEAMESALESAIPAAPASASESAASEAMGETRGDTSPHVAVTIPEESVPATAGIVDESVQSEPAQPEPIVAEAEPTPLSTLAPGVSGEPVTVVVDDLAPSNPAGATSSTANTHVPEATPSQLVPETPLVSQSTPTVSTPVEAPPIVAPEQSQPASWTAYEDPVTNTPLPEGLTESSPSVRQNAELVYSWRTDSQQSDTVLALFNWSIQRTEVEDARAWYKVLAVDNPTASQPLLALINLELALSNFPQVEEIFASTLKGDAGINAPIDVGIWAAYLHYIRRQNPILDGAPNNEQVRDTIAKAYDFALRECGNDRESGEIWDEYIKFVASGPSSNQWDTQAKTDNLRRIYQTAVRIPLNNIEALWKGYDAFETAQNKLTAKKFLAERSPAYMTARTALRELRTLTDRIPKPVIPARLSFTEQDRQAINAWKAYLKWEESNPLVIEDQEILQSRIEYALNKSLGEMRHFSEIWQYATAYYLKQNEKDKAIELVKAGVEACPKSFLLTFAYAELEEERKEYATCHALYSNLISKLNPEVDQLRKEIVKEVEIARGPPIPNAEKAQSAAAAGDVDMDGNDLQEIQKLVDERENRGRLVAERRGRDVDELMIGISVVWNMYMRFARRAEGIKSARAVFGKARKSPHLTWHVFEASAMVEYHSNKDSAVAIRIFELGLKLFAEDVDYVVQYLKYLISINDESNARALFGRSITKIAADKARPLYDAWAQYEYMYGDLPAAKKLEESLQEVYPNDAPLKRFAQRWCYNGIDEIAIRDLGFSQNRTSRASTQPRPAPHIAPAVDLAPAPPAPILAPALQESYKRPAPEDLARHDSGDYASRSPKRHRGQSPRREPPIDRDDRGPLGRYSREPSVSSKLPPAGPLNGLGSVAPAYGSPVVPSVASDKDRSGLGPVFRPDDMVKVFNSVTFPGASAAPQAAPIPRGPPPPVTGRGYYDDRDRRYGGPPRGRY